MAVSKIRNYVCRVTQKTTSAEGEVAEFHYEITQAGDYYRTDVSFGEGGLNQPQMIFAFDGERYQNFDQKVDTLSFSKNNRVPMPYGMPNPMILPYIWLFPDLAHDWSDVRDVDSWQQRKVGGFSISEGAMHLNYECVEVRFPQANGLPSAVVKLATEHDYFPVYVELPDRKSTISSRKLFSAAVGDAEVWVPQIVDVTDELSRYQYFLPEESIEINTPVDRSIFSLSPSMAGHVDDYDLNMKRLRNSGALPIQEGSSEQFPRPRAGLALVMFAGVAFLVWIHIKTRAVR